ncbi:hypothetical protein KIL84_017401, partial [Mauremys mutica]
MARGCAEARPKPTIYSPFESLRKFWVQTHDFQTLRVGHTVTQPEFFLPLRHYRLINNLKILVSFPILKLHFGLLKLKNIKGYVVLFMPCVYFVFLATWIIKHL